MKRIRISPPAGPLNGALTLPGSKSITNRALLLAALARGTSRLTGALKSDDTRYMAEALRAMGVGVEEPDDTTFVVSGSGKLNAPDGPLFLGNAGTAMRFLTAACATVEGEVVLDGDEHMQKRPIGPLVEALKSVGVDVEAPTGCPPVTVRGRGGFDGEQVEVDGSKSSQYVSAMMMLGACGTNAVTVSLTPGETIGATGYITLTRTAMEAFGAKITPQAGSAAAWKIAPGGYTAADLAIEPDASAATYPWAWAKITGGQISVGTPPAQFSQPDARAYGLMDPYPHMDMEIDGSQIQDAVPTLAVLAAYNEGDIRFTGIANLRVKECDRISALCEGLNRIKPGLAEESGDDLIVHGDPSLRGARVSAVIDPRADHRIAMAFAIAGLVTDGIEIEDPDCVAKTWPGYWKALKSLGADFAVLD